MDIQNLSLAHIITFQKSQHEYICLFNFRYCLCHTVVFDGVVYKVESLKKEQQWYLCCTICE